MDDPDTIAFIYPAEGDGYSYAELAISLPENKSRHVGPKLAKPVASQSLRELQVDRRVRERTKEPEVHDSLDYRPCLKLTFNDGPKTHYGIVSGSDPDCDFVLLETVGVSYHHLAFGFDDDYYFYVQDLGSTCGTMVKYGNKHQGRRRWGKCIIGGHDFLEDAGPIVVGVTQFLQFLVVVPVRNTKSPEYRAKVDKFRQGTAGTEDLFSGLKLKSRTATRRPSGTHSPLTGDVILSEKLGQGSFGVVWHVWNATTGKEYALKEPKDKYDQSRWRLEAEIMRRISHRHVVEFLGADFHPHPMLRIEYVRGGSLIDHLRSPMGFSRFECVEILRQSLDVVKYLHGMEPSIVHRDIAPGNILVHERGPKGIFIKFADFGLAKEGQHLKTICGNGTYLAPEVFHQAMKPFWERSGDKYTEAVDIWSLGVVITELLCDLPEWLDGHKDSNGLTWHERICARPREHFSKTQVSLALFVLSSMLPVQPEHRGSAKECYDNALILSDCSREARERPKSDSAARNESEESTFRLHVHDDRHKTVIFRGTRDPGNSLSSLDNSSLNGYVIGFQRPGTATANSMRTAERQRRVQRIMDKLSDPEHHLFIGSEVVDGIGENFDIKNDSSYTSEVAVQSGGRIDDASDPVADSAWEVVPNLTGLSPNGPTPRTTDWRWQGSARFDASDNIRALGALMREWSEKAGVSITTTELSQIWDDGFGSDGLQSKAQPRRPTVNSNENEPYRKRLRGNDDATPIATPTIDYRHGQNGSAPGPVSKRTKNHNADSEPEESNTATLENQD